MYDAVTNPSSEHYETKLNGLRSEVGLWCVHVPQANFRVPRSSRYSESGGLAGHLGTL